MWKLHLFRARYNVIETFLDPLNNRADHKTYRAILETHEKALGWMGSRAQLWDVHEMVLRKSFGPTPRVSAAGLKLIPQGHMPRKLSKYVDEAGARCGVGTHE